jgi:uncharacterized membrane protein YesL
MSKKREFGEGPIYTITNYVMWFFIGNFYFLLCNIPLVFVLLSFSGEHIPEYLFLLTLSALPVGPAYTALLSAMGKLVREKDVSMTRAYFSAYKTNFFQAFFFWALEIVLILVLILDIRFFATKSYGNFIIAFMYVMIGLVFFASLYIFPVVSRFYLKNLDVIKISFYFIAKKWKTTISCVAVLITSFAISYKFTSIAVLFIFSLMCYAIMLLQKDALKELEEKVTGNVVQNEIIQL